MEKRNKPVRPRYEEVRARAIKMGNILEDEMRMQRERNKAMNGTPVEFSVGVLWQNGKIITRRYNP